MSKPFANRAAIAVVAVVLVMMFLPFWGEVSLNGYVWMPYEYDSIEADFAEALGHEVNINDVIPAPILMLLLGVLTVVFGVWKPGKSAGVWLATAFGAVGVWGFLNCDVLRLGSTWGWMFALCALALTGGVGALLYFRKNE